MAVVVAVTLLNLLVAVVWRSSPAIGSCLENLVASFINIIVCCCYVYRFYLVNYCVRIGGEVDNLREFGEA